MASGALRLTLTGHINTVRGLKVSDRHPYLFSCSEDRTVKQWDLNTNSVVRHYHGHLSGVFCVETHPKLDHRPLGLHLEEIHDCSYAAFVAETQEGSQAAASGLKIGDILIKIKNQSMEDIPFDDTIQTLMATPSFIAALLLSTILTSSQDVIL